MRQFQQDQQSLTPPWGPHQHSQELRMVARILDAQPEIAARVQDDLLQGRRSDRGRPGLSGDQVLWRASKCRARTMTLKLVTELHT